MADGTHIEWTEATWNPITGCSVTSPGCANCYAMKLAGTRLAHHPSRAGLTIATKAGPVWTGEVRFNEQWLEQPLRWRRPRMIFVCAHGDLFHESVPDEWIDRVFAVMALASQHTFQVLTKRSARMREYLGDSSNLTRVAQLLDDVKPSSLWNGSVFQGRHEILGKGYLPNVWLGVSVEDQPRADERIPDLLATPAVVRWISAEPLLGPVSLEEAWHGENALDSECWGDCAWCEKGHPPLYNCHRGLQSEDEVGKYRSGLDWIVAGGESGPGARPMHPDWARSLRDQCAAAGVPFFFKQWGDWLPCEAPQTPDSSAPCLARDGYIAQRLGKKRAGRLLDEIEHNAMPEIRA